MIKELANYAKDVRTFLHFAVFIILSLTALFWYLFSKGAFDAIIQNINILEKEQLFILVMIIIVMIFTIVLLLIILSFIAAKDENTDTKDEKHYKLYVVVHEAGDKTKGIENSKITLLTIPKPQKEITDVNGSAIFLYTSDIEGKRVQLNATKSGFRKRKPLTIALKNDDQFFISLKKDRKPQNDSDIRPYPYPPNEISTIKLEIPGLSEISNIDIYLGCSRNNWGGDSSWKYEKGKSASTFFLSFNLGKNMPFKNFVQCRISDRNRVKKALNLAGYRPTSSGDESSTPGMWRIWFLMRDSDAFKVEGDGVFANNLT